MELLKRRRERGFREAEEAMTEEADALQCACKAVAGNKSLKETRAKEGVLKLPCALPHERKP